MCRGTAQVTVGLRRGCNKSQSQGPGRDLTLGNLCLSSNAPACGIPSAPSEGGKQYYANRSHIFIIRDIPREYNENHSADARAYQPPQPRPRVCPGKRRQAVGSIESGDAHHAVDSGIPGGEGLSTEMCRRRPSARRWRVGRQWWLHISVRRRLFRNKSSRKLTDHDQYKLF